MSIKVPIVSACVFGTALVHGARVPEGPYCGVEVNSNGAAGTNIRITGTTVKITGTISNTAVDCISTLEVLLAGGSCTHTTSGVQVTSGSATTYDGDKDEFSIALTVPSEITFKATKCATTTITLPTVTLPTVTAPKTITMPTVTVPDAQVAGTSGNGTSGNGTGDGPTAADGSTPAPVFSSSLLPSLAKLALAGAVLSGFLPLF